MIQRLSLFIGIVVLEAIAVLLLWLIADATPLFYTTMVIVVSAIAILWWRYTHWQEKQKIYDKETLRLQQKTTFVFSLKVLAGLTFLTYLIFIIKVALG